MRLHGPRGCAPGVGERRDPASLQEVILRDEELLVYVSADMQASPETSWAGAGGGKKIQQSQQVPTPGLSRSLGGGNISPGIPGDEARLGLNFQMRSRIGVAGTASKIWSGIGVGCTPPAGSTLAPAGHPAQPPSGPVTTPVDGPEARLSYVQLAQPPCASAAAAASTPSS